MADISEWSPVDESNNLPPPNGWPEGMAPSGVNNSARAVMGAVRRNYDTVTAQLASITTNFNNYLLLTGGTLSGSLFGTTIQAGQLTSTGNIGAAGIIAASLDVTAGRNMTVSNTVYTGNLDVSGTSTLATVTAASISATSITGTVSASSVTASGAVQGSYISSTGSIQAANDIDAVDTVSAGTITSRGGILATGGVGGSTVSSGGSITATLDVTAGRNMATTSIYASATVQGNYLYSTNLMRADGSLTTGFDITAGRDVISTADMTCGATFTSTVGYSNINAIQPRADHDGFVGRAGLSFDSMSCYNYITVSDARLKRDIGEPEGCLELVKAIPPRTYRWRDGPAERHWGLVAQEVGQAVYAAGVDFGGYRHDPESGEEGLAINELLALLWGAVRELSGRLEAMEEAVHAR